MITRCVSAINGKNRAIYILKVHSGGISDFFFFFFFFFFLFYENFIFQRKVEMLFAKGYN